MSRSLSSSSLTSMSAFEVGTASAGRVGLPRRRCLACHGLAEVNAQLQHATGALAVARSEANRSAESRSLHVAQREHAARRQIAEEEQLEETRSALSQARDEVVQVRTREAEERHASEAELGVAQTRSTKAQAEVEQLRRALAVSTDQLATQRLRNSVVEPELATARAQLEAQQRVAEDLRHERLRLLRDAETARASIEQLLEELEVARSQASEATWLQTEAARHPAEMSRLLAELERANANCESLRDELAAAVAAAEQRRQLQAVLEQQLNSAAALSERRRLLAKGLEARLGAYSAHEDEMRFFDAARRRMGEAEVRRQLASELDAAREAADEMRWESIEHAARRSAFSEAEAELDGGPPPPPAAGGGLARALKDAPGTRGRQGRARRRTPTVGARRGAARGAAQQQQHQQQPRAQRPIPFLVADAPARVAGPCHFWGHAALATVRIGLKRRDPPN